MIPIGQEIQWTNETDKKYKVFEAFSLCTIEALLFYASCPFSRLLQSASPEKKGFTVESQGGTKETLGDSTKQLQSRRVKCHNSKNQNLDLPVWVPFMVPLQGVGTVQKGLHNDSLGKKIYRLYSFLPPA